MSIPGELVIQTTLHRSGRWITVRVTVNHGWDFDAVVDTGAPATAVSPSVYARLRGDGLLQAATTPNRYRLASLTVDGQPLPDLEVGVVRRLDRLDVDALLGLDFLTKFAHIHFDTAALQLRLIPF